jgi:predicted dehydrogenase
MSKTRVAIIGLGMAVVPHAKSALDLAERLDVAYACSPSAARRASFAEKFPFPQCDRLETILDDASVDAVAVLTPPNTHLDIVGRCAAAGKHVLLEKPLEISTARAQRIVSACRAGRCHARHRASAQAQARRATPGRTHAQ